MVPHYLPLAPMLVFLSIPEERNALQGHKEEKSTLVN